MTSSMLPTYARYPLGFARGDGAWLEATDGARYLDLGGGIAVASLGYSHPHLVEALTAQAKQLWHTSNLFEIPQAERLATRLAAASFADYVFFTNSGAEALEGAIKTARKYHAASGHPERFHIITFDGAFHGRTYMTIAAGGTDKYIEGFGPKAPGFDRVPFGDAAAVEAAITPATAAILVEPIQGEGGIRVPPPDFLPALRRICDRHGLLLVLDEVQCGMGRTGKLFACEHVGVTPDIMALAKGIGGGFPLGAFLATKEAGKGMVVGTHGTTYGGNPLATAVGNAVLDIVLADGFIEAVATRGRRFKQKLEAMARSHGEIVAGVRGQGLMLGLQLRVPPNAFAAAARDAKVLVIPAGDNVVRLLPPLVISEAELDEGVDRLAAACRSMSSAASAGGGGRPSDAHAPRRRRRRPTLHRSRGNPRAGPAAHPRSCRGDEIGVAQGASRARTSPLAGKTLAMIFDKPSTRTRVSFDVGMRQLGGESIMLTGKEMAARPRRKASPDTARVLSRFVDAILIRILDHSAVTELAQYAEVPIINGLTKKSHPCQLMADVMTFEEHRGPDRGPDRRLVWRRQQRAVRAGFRPRNASASRCASRRRKRSACLRRWRNGRARRRPTSCSRTIRRAAVDGADCVVTDCWLSMGDEEKTARAKLLKPFQVDAKLMSRAGEGRAVHALPAGPSRRGGHRRGDRRAAIRCVRRGREPAACAKRHPDVVPGDDRLMPGFEPFESDVSRPVSDLGHDDLVLPFAVEPLDVRGRIVRLGPSVDHILAQHAYPAPVARLVGEAAALTVLPRLGVADGGPFPAADQE